MKTYLKLFISISFLLTACTSLKVNQDAAFEYTNYSSIYSHYLACDSEYVTRMPSAAEMCSELFKSHEAPSTLKETEYLKKLQANPLARAEANMAKSMEADPYPISLSSEMRRFRDRVLGYIKNTSYRETLVRSFESALRMKSNLLESAMASKNNYSNYDLVIVGTGVHGIIALHKAISMDPGLKILLIDEGDTAGATFRYGKEVFDINSSNRRSGEDTRPLPGEGNINELPYLPIQVSDLTAVKYPTANDLGTALVAGLYAAVREHPGVDVLFNARANQVALTAQDPKFKESLTFQSTATGRSFRVDAQAVITATGLGEPSLPEKVAQTVKARPELAQETTPDKIPRVITFEDYLRILGSSNEPGKFFSNKKIGIVGKGDSAKVLIQYLLGFAPREGYARTSAQDGQVARIYWSGINPAHNYA